MSFLLDGMSSPAGFLNPAEIGGPGNVSHLPASQPLFSRFVSLNDEEDRANKMLAAMSDSINRSTNPTDVPAFLQQIATMQAEFQRQINSQVTAFPVRENLEAEVKLLIPLDTPVRNRLRRVPGAGTASAWRQAVNLGGGWGTGVDQPGGSAVLQAFYSETGSPVEHATTYASKTAPYKLLGVKGSVTGFAAAAGANFMNQVAAEKTNQILNLMLMEEYALINSSSTSTAAPWGDGTNALGFDGLINLITTANGTPATQVQTAIGALTQNFIDGQLANLFKQGASNVWILAAAQEVKSLVRLAEGSSSVIRVQAGQDGKSVLGLSVTGYMHPITGQMVDVVASRFVPSGTMIFMCDRLPQGSAALDVNVLPQVQLPQLAPNDNVQGYVAKELPPSQTAPDVYPFMISVYEVVRMFSAAHFAIGTGITAV